MKNYTVNKLLNLAYFSQNTILQIHIDFSELIILLLLREIVFSQNHQ